MQIQRSAEEMKEGEKSGAGLSLGRREMCGKGTVTLLFRYPNSSLPCSTSLAIKSSPQHESAVPVMVTGPLVLVPTHVFLQILSPCPADGGGMTEQVGGHLAKVKILFPHCNQNMGKS